MKPEQVDKREKNNDRFKVLVKSESHCSGGDGEEGCAGGEEGGKRGEEGSHKWDF